VRAEALYGQACLYAIQEDGALAAAFLRGAGDTAGENTYAFVNRAILDEDFESVRARPELQALLVREEGTGRAR